ncbi:hypothetical protein J4217_04845 [Candidatus Pacearchaeota archaeon]|nr:hypothetical protein [Candidatus Pacearchaeota archaeon]
MEHKKKDKSISRVLAERIYIDRKELLSQLYVNRFKDSDYAGYYRGELK